VILAVALAWTGRTPEPETVGLGQYQRVKKQCQEVQYPVQRKGGVTAGSPVTIQNRADTAVFTQCREMVVISSGPGGPGATMTGVPGSSLCATGCGGCHTA
jgi:hypothetical protein